MSVVTVSRQFGAGGLAVAPALAAALDYRLVDREIVEEAAWRLGVDPEVARARDERAPALVEEIGMALAAGTPPFAGAPPPPVPEETMSDEALAETTRRVILSFADAGGYVILGRGAQAVLSDRLDACHVALVASPPDRIRRVAESRRLDERAAAALCEAVDADRAAYVRRFYGRDIRDPLLYDCVLNTSRLGLEDTVATAVGVSRRKLGLG